MRYPLLAISLFLAVFAGTLGTLCVETGLCDDAILFLPVFLAGFGGVVAFSCLRPSHRDTIDTKSKLT